MTRTVMIRKPNNLLQYVSQDGIKLVNLLSRMCPICVNQKMSSEHLLKHRVKIPKITTEVFTLINQKAEKERKESKVQKSSITTRRE